MALALAKPAPMLVSLASSSPMKDQLLMREMPSQHATLIAMLLAPVVFALRAPPMTLAMLKASMRGAHE